jgi:hypothetical protein
MANRKARALARKSAPVAVNADQAEQALIDARREQMLAEAEASIAQDEVATEVEIVQAPTEGSSITGLVEIVDPTDGYDGLAREEIEAQQNTTEPVYATTPEGAAVEIEERELGHAEPAIAAEVAATEAAAVETPEPAAPDVTDGGRLLASRFPDSNEALAYAGNMKLRNYSISRQDDGQYAIEVRKAGAPTTPTQAATAAPQATRSAPKIRTPRAKATAPRPDTRNAVIWAMLTRPEGTTLKEVTSAMDDFERARGRENLFPTGIGSDAKLFSGRFGYDWKKTSDADGSTRYFCFPFAAPEVEVEVESEQEPVAASESESAAS